MSTEKKNILEIKDLVVHYDTESGVVRAANGINITLQEQESLGLVGETGAGKTTTALSILRMIPDPPGKIISGSVTIDGVNLMSLTEKQMEAIRGKEVSMIFQDPMTALNPVFTVGEQIAESIQIHEHVNSREAMERAKDILEIVGIHRDRAGDYPHQLSGGMKQRVVIAIALACHTTKSCRCTSRSSSRASPMRASPKTAASVPTTVNSSAPEAAPRTGDGSLGMCWPLRLSSAPSTPPKSRWSCASISSAPTPGPASWWRTSARAPAPRRWPPSTRAAGTSALKRPRPSSPSLTSVSARRRRRWRRAGKECEPSSNIP